MTREELIRYGKDYLNDLENAYCDISDKHMEFVRQSIKALSAEPCCNCIEFKRYAKEMGFEIEQEPCDCDGCEKDGSMWGQEPCDDCISRAEAMTEIMMFAGNVKSDEEDIYIKVSDAVQLLRELPPANLQESKYCDRDICTKNEYNGIGCDECEVTKSQKPKTEWIPVSERLPENSGNYLITYCLRDKIETQEAVYAKDEEDKWFDITDIEITLAVIAWMPLPEPYKAERNDKE